MVYCVYYTRPQGKSSNVRNMPLKACSKWLIAKLLALKMRGTSELKGQCADYSRCLASTLGAENMFPFWSELRWKASHKLQAYFVRSSRLLCSKFETTSFEVRHYSFEVWGHFIWSAATSYEMRTYVPVNFVQSLGQLRTNFKPASCEACEVWTTHGNIISVTAVPSKWPSVRVCSSPAVGRTTNYWVSNYSAEISEWEGRKLLKWRHFCLSLTHFYGTHAYCLMSL